MLGREHITQYPQIQDFIVQKEPFDKLWTTAVHFHAQYDKWMNGPLLNVNAEVVEEEVLQYNSSVIFLQLILLIIICKIIQNSIDFTDNQL